MALALVVTSGRSFTSSTTLGSRGWHPWQRTLFDGAVSRTKARKFGAVVF